MHCHELRFAMIVAQQMTPTVHSSPADGQERKVRAVSPTRSTSSSRCGCHPNLIAVLLLQWTRPDKLAQRGLLACRAQVVLAAVQSPLLGDSKHASVLVPRLCSCILMAPQHCRHVSCPPASLTALGSCRSCRILDTIIVAIGLTFTTFAIAQSHLIAPIQL